MRRFIFILLSAFLAFASCQNLELEPVASPAQDVCDGKVEVTFKVKVPNNGISTKTGMAETPSIARMHVAVFGGSDFFNEWVQASSFEPATENYDPSDDDTVYDVTFRLSMSSSRLKLHFIANCPEAYITNAPISNDSSKNTEDYIMSTYLRSKINETNNDGYWQKIILPYGITAKVDETTGQYLYNMVNGEKIYTPDDDTKDQFPDTIVLVRNFARIYIVNATNDVDIIAYDLAYAPEEGPFAPILSAPYTSNAFGEPITIADDDITTKVWNESFFINIQDHPVIVPEGATGVTSCADAPYYYKGFSPSGISQGTFPDDYTDFKGQWAGARTDAQNPLYVYERIAPSKELPATRILIYAQKQGETPKYYSLDILNNDKEAVPLIRNNTYTVVLTGIAANTGETNPANAAETSSSNIAQSAAQEIQEISDGSTSIGTSYTEKVFVSPVSSSDPEGAVYFRYLSDTANKTLDLEHVTLEFGFKEGSTWTPITPETTQTQLLTNVSIEKNGNTVVQYVRKNNAWVIPGEGDEELERWGKITFSTITGSDYVNAAGYYKTSLNETIRVKGESTIYRDVTIKIMPRQKLIVKCLQPYIATNMGEKEVVRVYIPTDLSRAVFPLEFQIESDAGSLTPDNDVLPVENGPSIVFNTTSGASSSAPSYHFIKTLTYNEYTEWVDDVENREHIESVNGTDYIFFDCHFKSNTLVSASTVYVKNLYFDYGLGTTTYDTFYNYYQREFTIVSLSSVAAGQKATFQFRMDYANNGKTGDDVKWHDQTPNSFSNNYRVLPKVVNVILEGCHPDTDPRYSDELEVNNDGDGYIFHVYTSGDAGTYISSNPIQTLHLVVDDDTESYNYSVTLFTESLYNKDSFPITDFYKPATKTATTYTFTANFASTKISCGVGKTDDFTFNYNENCIEPVTVTFTNCIPTGDTRFKKVSNGVYLFTPNDNNTAQTFNVTMNTESDRPTILLQSANYSNKSTQGTRKTLRTGNTATINYSSFRNSTTATNNNVTMGLVSNISYSSSGYLLGDNSNWNIVGFTSSLDEFTITKVVFNCSREYSYDIWDYVYYTPDAEYSFMTDSGGENEYGTYSTSNNRNPTGTWTGSISDMPAYFVMYNSYGIRITSVQVTYSYQY